MRTMMQRPQSSKRWFSAGRRGWDDAALDAQEDMVGMLGRPPAEGCRRVPGDHSAYILPLSPVVPIYTEEFLVRASLDVSFGLFLFFRF